MDDMFTITPSNSDVSKIFWHRDGKNVELNFGNMDTVIKLLFGVLAENYKLRKEIASMWGNTIRNDVDESVASKPFKDSVDEARFAIEKMFLEFEAKDSIAKAEIRNLKADIDGKTKMIEALTKIVIEQGKEKEQSDEPQGL